LPSEIKPSLTVLEAGIKRRNHVDIQLLQLSIIQLLHRFLQEIYGCFACIQEIICYVFPYFRKSAYQHVAVARPQFSPSMQFLTMQSWFVRTLP
ncbi:MAG: hypothetical protein U9R60_14490, partial [Bacteroidota bacterium]|nr:hypothetical protein [Bacteroidota bacterium]